MRAAHRLAMAGATLVIAGLDAINPATVRALPREGAALATLTAPVAIHVEVGRRERMSPRAVRGDIDRVTTSLLARIGEVVGIAPEEKMIGADAARIVATVEHANVRWNRAERELECEPVGADIRSVRRGELSVAAGRERTAPEPAALGLLDLRPEAIGGGESHAVKGSGFDRMSLREPS